MNSNLLIDCCGIFLGTRSLCLEIRGRLRKVVGVVGIEVRRVCAKGRKGGGE